MIKRYHIPELEPLAMHRTECNIKRSLFVCSMGHAPDMDTARAFVERIKKEFPDATHNCWAFAAGPPADTARVGFSDDGEPHGTAGRPMLSALLHSEVGELVCVVTRYFGGVKLGTGGLVRAYQGAVLDNLTSLPRIERIIPIYIKLRLNYNHVETLRRMLADFEAKIVQEDFADKVDFTLCMPMEREEGFIAAIVDVTNGLAQILPCDLR